MSVYFVEYKQGMVTWTSKWRRLRLGKNTLEFFSQEAAQKFSESLLLARGVVATRVLTPDPEAPWEKLKVVSEETAA